MMKQRAIILSTAVLLLTVCSAFQLFGQFKSKGVRGGIGGGSFIGSTEKADDELSISLRGFIRHNIEDYIDGDFAASYGEIMGSDYQSYLWLAEYKFLCKAYVFNRWEPYIGTGVGIGYYFANLKYRSQAFNKSAFFGYIPLAGGVEYALTDAIQIDVNVNYNYSFSDAIVTNKITNSNGGGANDAWWGIFAGISYTFLWNY